MQCINCKKEVNIVNMGIKIDNFCLKDFPKELVICEDCTFDMAVSLHSGNLATLLKLGSKFLKKGKS